MAHYVIRVTGRLSDDLLSAFPTLLAEAEPVNTVLHGPLPDQSALTGVLDHLDELGIEILAVTQVPALPAPNRSAPPV